MNEVEMLIKDRLRESDGAGYIKPIVTKKYWWKECIK